MDVSSGVIVAVDGGGTKTDAVAIDRDGRIVARSRHATGWGPDAIAATIMERAFDYLDAPVLSLTGKDVPMPYAANLEKLALITSDDVVEAVRKVTYR